MLEEIAVVNGDRLLNTAVDDLWVSPGIPDTFDRCEDDIGGVRWREDGSLRSSSVRR